MTKSKVLGIVGGVGATATADIYLNVFRECSKLKLKHRPHILISSLAGTVAMENKLANGINTYTSFVKRECVRLQQAGAGFIIIPCNSIHSEIAKIRKAVKIPIISIIDETISAIKSRGYKTVGLLGSGTTISKELYHAPLRNNEIGVIAPSHENQERINAVILSLYKNSYDREKEVSIMYEIIDELKNRGAECIVLACTDLQMLKPERSDIEIVDTMEVFGLSAAKYIIKGDQRRK